MLGDVWGIPRFLGVGLALAAVVMACVEMEHAPLEASEASAWDHRDEAGA